MTDRVVIFDKTTGEPVAMIQTSDPTLILLNSDEDQHAIAPATEVDWRNTELDTSTGKVTRKDPELPAASTKIRHPRAK